MALPVSIREALGWKAGDIVVLAVSEGVLVGSKLDLRGMADRMRRKFQDRGEKT